MEENVKENFSLKCFSILRFLFFSVAVLLAMQMVQWSGSKFLAVFLFSYFVLVLLGFFLTWEKDFIE